MKPNNKRRLILNLPELFELDVACYRGVSCQDYCEWSNMFRSVDEMTSFIANLMSEVPEGQEDNGRNPFILLWVRIQYWQLDASQTCFMKNVTPIDLGRSTNTFTEINTLNRNRLPFSKILRRILSKTLKHHGVNVRYYGAE